MPDDEVVPEVVVGEADRALSRRLGDELTGFNVRATGIGDERGLSVQVRDGDGELLAGLSGWTWGTCAGISLVWVREDHRRSGLGARMLAAAEAEARDRGCTQVLVSSFTFQAPAFYQRHGYVEFARTEGIPTAGSADVHMGKTLAGPAPARQDVGSNSAP